MKNKNKFIIVSVIILILGYFLFYQLYLRRDDTYTLSYGDIYLNIDAETFILRDEVVVKTNSSGQIQYFVAEGEKVKKYQLIAQVQYIQKNEDDIASEKENVTSDDLRVDIEEIGYDIRYLFSKIMFAISTEKYSEVYDLKEELKLKLDKKERLKSENQDIDYNESEFSEVENGEVIKLLSPKSGIVSYYIDGYEDVFINENILKIEYSKLLDKDINMENYSTQIVNDGDIIYKVVNNNYYKLVSLVDKYYTDFFEKGKEINVVINDEIATGTVVDSFDEGDYLVVVMDMYQLVSGYQKNRKVSAQLIPANYRGLLIYNDSLVKVNGRYGVYILNIENKKVFVPIKIIGYDDDNAIVFEGSFYEDVDGIKTRIPTVKLFDEVLRNGERYLNPN